MPVLLLTAVDHDRLFRYPSEVSMENLSAYATLSDADLGTVPQQRRDAFRLAVPFVALQALASCRTIWSQLSRRSYTFLQRPARLP